MTTTIKWCNVATCSHHFFSVHRNQQYENNGKWLRVRINESMCGKTVEEILKNDLNISGRMIQGLTRVNGLFLNGKAPYLKQKVNHIGAILKVKLCKSKRKEFSDNQMANSDICVVYEDEHLLVVNKPYGLSVHSPTKARGKENSVTLVTQIVNYLKSKGDDTAAGNVCLVHRLDRDTSGLMLIAKNGYIQNLLSKQWAEGKAIRSYIALVHGHLNIKEGTIRQPIAKDPKNGSRRIIDSKGEEAITNYKISDEYQDFSLVIVTPETGKTHQIRLHFSHIGHFIIGDYVYGKPSTDISRYALHSWKLQFNHPVYTDKVMVLEQEMPSDMLEYIQKRTPLHPPVPQSRITITS